MSAYDKIADEFEIARPMPMPAPDAVPSAIDDTDTKPGWIVAPARRPVAADLSKRHRTMLRQLVIVANLPEASPSAVARAIRTALKHFTSPPETRDAAIAFLADLAVDLDTAAAGGE
jgi:hypothetical protein